jgi:hypothetical protein
VGSSWDAIKIELENVKLENVEGRRSIRLSAATLSAANGVASGTGEDPLSSNTLISRRKISA